MQIELEALKRRLYKDNSVKNIKFFPGSNADASAEDFAREINKYFEEAAGNSESKNDLDLDEHLDS